MCNNTIPKLTLPTIHLNGTSKESLVETLCDAAIAVQNAMAKLGETAPNGRDYYPQGNQAFLNARTQHEDRCTKLRVVYKELEQLALLIESAT